MITIHKQSSQSQFRTMAYGLVDPMTVQWCNERSDQFRSELHPEAQSYYQSLAGTVFEKMDYGALHNNLRIAQRTTNGLWGEELIRRIVDIESIQHIPDVMLNYVMANPEISQYYDKQEIAGFDERYVDPFPNRKGEDNPIYQAVTNGVWLPTGNGDEYKCVEYFDSEDEMLPYMVDFYEQTSIIDTWNATLAFIKQGGEDPTSANNATL